MSSRRIRDDGQLMMWSLVSSDVGLTYYIRDKTDSSREATIYIPERDIDGSPSDLEEVLLTSWRGCIDLIS